MIYVSCHITYSISYFLNFELFFLPLPLVLTKMSQKQNNSCQWWWCIFLSQDTKYTMMTHLNMIFPNLSWSTKRCCFSRGYDQERTKRNRGYGRLDQPDPLWTLLSLLDRTGGCILLEMTHCMVCLVVSWWQLFCQIRRVYQFLYHTDHSWCSVPEIPPSVLFSLLGLTSSLHTQLSTKSTSSHQELLQPKNFHLTDCNDWIALFSLL